MFTCGDGFRPAMGARALVQVDEERAKKGKKGKKDKKGKIYKNDTIQSLYFALKC